MPHLAMADQQLRQAQAGFPGGLEHAQQSHLLAQRHLAASQALHSASTHLTQIVPQGGSLLARAFQDHQLAQLQQRAAHAAWQAHQAPARLAQLEQQLLAHSADSEQLAHYTGPGRELQAAVQQARLQATRWPQEAAQLDAQAQALAAQVSQARQMVLEAQRFAPALQEQARVADQVAHHAEAAWLAAQHANAPVQAQRHIDWQLAREAQALAQARLAAASAVLDADQADQALQLAEFAHAGQGHAIPLALQQARDHAAFRSQATQAALARAAAVEQTHQTQREAEAQAPHMADEVAALRARLADAAPAARVDLQAALQLTEAEAARVQSVLDLRDARRHWQQLDHQRSAVAVQSTHCSTVQSLQDQAVAQADQAVQAAQLELNVRTASLDQLLATFQRHALEYAPATAQLSQQAPLLDQARQAEQAAALQLKQAEAAQIWDRFTPPVPTGEAPEDAKALAAAQHAFFLQHQEILSQAPLLQARQAFGTQTQVWQGAQQRNVLGLALRMQPNPALAVDPQQDWFAGQPLELVSQLQAQIQTIGGPQAALRIRHFIHSSPESGVQDNLVRFEVAGLDGQTHFVAVEPTTEGGEVVHFENEADYEAHNRFTDDEFIFTLDDANSGRQASSAGTIQLASAAPEASLKPALRVRAAHRNTLLQNVRETADPIMMPLFFVGAAAQFTGAALVTVGTLGAGTPLAALLAGTGWATMGSAMAYGAVVSSEYLIEAQSHGRSLASAEALMNWAMLAGTATGVGGLLLRNTLPQLAKGLNVSTVGLFAGQIGYQGYSLATHWQQMTAEQRREAGLYLGLSVAMLGQPYLSQRVLNSLAKRTQGRLLVSGQVELDQAYATLKKSLGVKRDISLDDLKRTYKRFARTHHPDVNPDPKATELFDQVTVAFERVSNHLNAQVQAAAAAAANNAPTRSNEPLELLTAHDPSPASPAGEQPVTQQASHSPALVSLDPSMALALPDFVPMPNVAPALTTSVAIPMDTDTQSSDNPRWIHTDDGLTHLLPATSHANTPIAQDSPGKLLAFRPRSEPDPEPPQPTQPLAPPQTLPKAAGGEHQFAAFTPSASMREQPSLMVVSNSGSNGTPSAGDVPPSPLGPEKAFLNPHPIDTGTRQHALPDAFLSFMQCLHQTEQHLNSIMQGIPDVQDTHELALAHTKLNQLWHASTTLKRLVRTNPQDFEWSAYLGYLQSHLDNLDLALSHRADTAESLQLDVLSSSKPLGYAEYMASTIRPPADVSLPVEASEAPVATMPDAVRQLAIEEPVVEATSAPSDPIDADAQKWSEQLRSWLHRIADQLGVGVARRMLAQITPWLTEKMPSRRELRDLSIAPSWIARIDEDALRGVLLQDRSKWRVMRVNRIVQGGAVATATSALGLMLRYLPSPDMLLGKSAAERVMTVSSALLIYGSAAAFSWLMAYWTRTYDANFAKDVVRQARQLVMNHIYVERAEHDLSPAEIRLLSDMGDHVLNALNGFGKRIRTQTVVAAGALAGSGAFMGPTGMLTTGAVTALTLSFATIYARILGRRSTEIANLLKEKTAADEAYKGPRISEHGPFSLYGLGVSLERVKQQMDELFSAKLDTLYDSNKTADRSYFTWLSLRESLILGSIPSLAIAMLPKEAMLPLVSMAMIVGGTGSLIAQDTLEKKKWERTARLFGELVTANEMARSERGTPSVSAPFPAGQNAVVSADSLQIWPDSEPMSFTLQGGYITVLGGVNGAGKTSLMKFLFGLRLAADGTAYYGPTPHIALTPEEIRKYSVIITPQTIPDLAIDLLADYPTVDERLKALHQVGLPDDKAKSLAQLEKVGLSSGQLARLAQLTLLRPNSNLKLVMLDEAEVLLDHEGKENLLGLLTDLAKSGAIVIVSTNSSPVVLRPHWAHNSRMLLLGPGGVVLADGPISDIVYPYIRKDTHKPLPEDASIAMERWLRGLGFGIADEIKEFDPNKPGNKP